MSRIGKQPIVIPEKVTIKRENGNVVVKGALGELSLDLPVEITLEIGDKELNLTRSDDGRKTRSYHGLFRMLLANMVKGVSEGFEKALQLVGTGYRVSQQGDDLQILVGYSKPVMFKAITGVKLVADGNTRIVVKGINKELVDQVAANIRALRTPDAYKGKGLRYEGEVVEKKAGKSMVS